MMMSVYLSLQKQKKFHGIYFPGYEPYVEKEIHEQEKAKGVSPELCFSWRHVVNLQFSLWFLKPFDFQVQLFHMHLKIFLDVPIFHK